jgi:hypothetical protein
MRKKIEVKFKVTVLDFSGRVYPLPPLRWTAPGCRRERRCMALQSGKGLDCPPSGHKRHHLFRIRIRRELAPGQKVFCSEDRLDHGQERGSRDFLFFGI